MTASSTTLEDLKIDFENKSETAKNYKEAMGIQSLESSDVHYLELLIARDEAYYNYMEVFIGEPRFSNVHGRVIQHRLRRYQDLLKSRKGGVV